MKKKLLIDLMNLENEACGFGQIAMNYHILFAKANRQMGNPFELYFGVPKDWRGKKIEGVNYVALHKNHGFLHKIFPFLKKYPKPVDIWFSVNQDCRVLPKQKSTKIILTIHDLNFLFEISDVTKRERKRREIQQKIDRATVVTFISKYAEEITRENFKLDNKIPRVIYNGVEPLVGKATQKPDFVIGEAPFFLNIGVFSEKKNQKILLDMMKHFPDKKLYLCGDMDTTYGREVAQKVIDEKIDNIILPGKISNEARIWLYQNCQAYLFPSIGEGFGLPAIEAMQFGKAVYIADAQALPEICGGHAILWKNLNATKMAQTIKATLEDFNKDITRIEKAKEHAASFSYDKHVESYMQLFQEVIS